MVKHPSSVTRRFLAALCTLVLASGVTAPPPAAAYNFGFSPSTTSGGTTAACSGTTYEGLGASGSSPSITLPAGACLIYLDSGTATDTFATVTLTLSPTHTDGTTSFGFITTRAISTVQFQNSTGDVTPIYVNGTTATSLTAVQAGQTFEVVYVGGGAHVQSPAVLIGSASGSGSGGSSSAGGAAGGGGSFAVASGSGSGIGPGQAARVYDFRNTLGINIQPWYGPDDTSGGPVGGPFNQPESRLANCAFANGDNTSGCTQNVGCTHTYDADCFPNQDAFFIFGLNYLGIKHVRTVGTVDRLLDIGANVPGFGIDFNVYFQGLDGFTTTVTQQVQGIVPVAAYIESFEGQNEPDLNTISSAYGSSDPGQQNRSLLNELTTAMSANGFSGKPVFGPSVTPFCGFTGAQFSCYGDYNNLVSAGATYSNLHDYMSSDYIVRASSTGGDFLAANHSAESAAYSPNPLSVATEAGVPTNPYFGSWGCCGGVTPAVAAKFDLAYSYDAWGQSIKRHFFYQLVADCLTTNQSSAAASGNFECDFGFFDDSFNKKPAAIIFHNNNTVMNDTGANAATFTTGSVAFTTSGLPSNTGTFLFEDSVGSYYIVLNPQPTGVWNTPSSNGAQGSANTISPVAVTVNLAGTYASVSVYDPSGSECSGTCVPVSSASSVSSVVAQVSDHPVIIKFHN